MELNNTKMKMQYILDENKNLAEIPLTDMLPVEYPIKYKLISAFEVFVRVPQTENYWISNYGRCVNNHRNPNKNKFYEHKQGQCHYTVYEIERIEEKVRGKKTGKTIIETWKRETSSEELVARSFLKPYKFRHKIWHKNGDFDDNWYKNLLYVSDKDFRNLKAGKITWQELGYEQEYIEYVNNAKNQAMTAYGSISSRCKGENNSESAHKCYDDVEMCQEWKDNPQLFVKRYLELYYAVAENLDALSKGENPNTYVTNIFGDSLKDTTYEAAIEIIANKWTDLTKSEKSILAEELGGVRNKSYVIALFDHVTEN